MTRTHRHLTLRFLEWLREEERQHQITHCNVGTVQLRLVLYTRDNETLRVLHDILDGQCHAQKKSSLLSARLRASGFQNFDFGMLNISAFMNNIGTIACPWPRRGWLRLPSQCYQRPNYFDVLHNWKTTSAHCPAPCWLRGTPFSSRRMSVYFSETKHETLWECWMDIRNSLTSGRRI